MTDDESLSISGDLADTTVPDLIRSIVRSSEWALRIIRDLLDVTTIEAGRLALLALYAVTLLAGLRWATSNLRQIDAQHTAVVTRLGAIDRVRSAGLLWALPASETSIVAGINQAVAEALTASGGEISEAESRRVEVEPAFAAEDVEEDTMGKTGRKRRARKKKGANHGKRPNA